MRAKRLRAAMVPALLALSVAGCQLFDFPDPSAEGAPSAGASASPSLVAPNAPSEGGGAQTPAETLPPDYQPVAPDAEPESPAPEPTVDLP